MLTFIILNTLVALSAVILIKKAFHCADLPERICVFSTLFFTQIVVSELILGMLGMLFIPQLIGINTLILILIWLFFRKKKSGPINEVLVDRFDWLFKNKVILFCISVILGFLLVKTIYNLINPPFGWDSLNYHFTFPVEWLKSGNLLLPPTISDDPSPTYYPINGSLYYYWLIAPFRNVMLADLGQIPFLIISFFAVFSIARKIKLSKELSFYAAAIFMVIPNYFEQIEVGYVDIIMATLFLLCINFLLNLNKEFNIKNLILSGIAAGLFFGIKTLSLAYSLALILFFLLILIKHARGFKFIGYGGMFVILMAVLGGYGYIRNFIVTGNPLFPLNFVIFKETVFKGVMPTATYLVRWDYQGYNLGKLFFREGMGPQLLLLIFPATFLAFPIALYKKRKVKIDLALGYILFLPAILLAIFTFIIPQLWTRFLYPYLGIGAIVAFFTLSVLKVPIKVIKTLVVICFLASIAEFSGYWELGFSLAAVLILFVTLPYFLRICKEKRFKVDVVFSLIVLFLALIAFTQKWYLKNEYKRYITYARYWEGAMKAWDWLNENTSGDNIAYTGRPVPLPLYGTNFKNDVYYVSVNDTHPAWLHKFPRGNLNWKVYKYEEIDKVLRRDENYRGNADFLSWYKNILAQDIDYLFVYILNDGKYHPIEDKWASAHNDRFELVFDSQDARIYKVIK